LKRFHIARIVGGMENNISYLSLELLAIKLNLPQGYIRRLADRNLIPFLLVGGRKRVNPEQVRAALDKIAQGAGNE
jgi:excisionase family DNA binding protein